MIQRRESAVVTVLGMLLGGFRAAKPLLQGKNEGFLTNGMNLEAGIRKKYFLLSPKLLTLQSYLFPVA
jgi:hypothetical protein